ncbi:histone-like nucleoid-structuring protein Lsr2 [Agromyces bauzanensis]|uniref:Lsr2 family protein n=1 Tax=Agromyces bauzanensis TaxID=1308924 RepID=A0A917PVY3_9MICO|nr:Lsr2 family protein [Agromyces bauzanensis]GGJ93702.1 Lsr2 family protein [Agromyces bauzanensis]
MATKTVVTLVDDIDGTDADETVAFTIDGTSYEIDLSADNAAAFRAALQPYVDAARRAPGRGGRRGAVTTAPSKEIRAWAEANGINVPARGRIPATVQERYRTANA